MTGKRAAMAGKPVWRDNRDEAPKRRLHPRAVSQFVVGSTVETEEGEEGVSGSFGPGSQVKEFHGGGLKDGGGSRSARSRSGEGERAGVERRDVRERRAGGGAREVPGFEGVGVETGDGEGEAGGGGAGGKVGGGG